MKAVVEYLLQTYGLAGVVIVALSFGIIFLWRHQNNTSALMTGVIKGNTEALEAMKSEVANNTKQSAMFNASVLQVFERTLTK